MLLSFQSIIIIISIIIFFSSIIIIIIIIIIINITITKLSNLIGYQLLWFQP